jgi:hypothetical protein
MANATAVSVIAVTTATIAKVALWFISQRISSGILYLRCFTAIARNREVFVDIFKHRYIGLERL